MTTRPTLTDQDSEAVRGAGYPAQREVPLGEDANEQILRDILGADADQELIDFAAGARGNPRLLAELALGLAEEGLVRRNNGTVQLTERRVPRRTMEYVKCQLGNLSTDCQQLLKVAAALGRSFVLEDLSRMLGRSPATLLSPLDEAMAAGFLVVVEQQLAFQSDFILRGIIESIPSPVCTALRREAMLLFRKRTRVPRQGTQENGPRLWVAPRPTEPYAAVKEDSGGPCSRAHSLIMNGDAKAGVHVAERILANPDASPSARLDAEASMILGYFLLGRDEADRISNRVLRDRGSAPGDIAALMALTTRSNVLWRGGELTESLSLGRTAVRYSAECNPVWRLHFQLALAGKLANLREFDEAEALIIDAEAGLRGLPTPVWTAAPEAMRSRLLLQSGRIGEARREATLASAAADRDAVPMLRPLAYSVLCAASSYMGELSSAIEYLKLTQRDVASQVVLDSPQYAWTEVLITIENEGPQATVQLLSDKYSHLPTQRSLYIEDPSAAAFLIRLARDVGDSNLKRSVLETVDGLAGDNPEVSITGLTAMHANALANSAPAALALIIAQSPDPISVALATEELAKIYATKARMGGGQTTSTYSEEDGLPYATRWSALSDMERRIACLVSAGMTNRQIGKQVYLSSHTVNYHLRKIYRKLGISTRVELAHGAATYSHSAATYSKGDEEQQVAARYRG